MISSSSSKQQREKEKESVTTTLCCLCGESSIVFNDTHGRQAHLEQYHKVTFDPYHMRKLVMSVFLQYND